ncbi:MAG: acyclic terpene utilization AtuA family protein [Pigmentiphaga sp.]
MKDTVRIGAGSGFWGDALDPAVELLEQGELDYMSFDFLAELTMALLQRLRGKDPEAGYVPDAIEMMRTLMPLARQHGTRLISNGGGVNPAAAGRRIVAAARELGLNGTRVGVVEGDDLLSRLDEIIASGIPLVNLDTGDSDFARVRGRVVAANAYTDASGIIQALEQKSDVVVAGRVSDNALYVAPLMHEFGWNYASAHTNHVAAAITVGHVLECAGACSGGLHSRFNEMPHMGRLGFPYADFSSDGSAVISKVAGSGGHVDAFTIKEHLLYEINDPRRYVMPDGVADFTSLRLEDLGGDRVRLSDMSGAPRPDMLKLVIGYQDGWIGEGMLFFPWPYALDRARKAHQTLLERFERLGLQADEIQIDYIGMNMLHGPAAPPTDHDHNEVGLRVAVRTRSRDEAEKVRRACSHMWIMGPGGTSFGTPMKPRPVVSLWPTLVPRELVQQTVTVLEV